MAIWQIALLALGLAWIVQSIGVWLQVRHYQGTFSAVRKRWSDGRLGTGAAPARVGKGVIVILVVNSSNVVRQLLVMQGRSVFAKFRDYADFAGLSIGDLKERTKEGGIDRGVAQAIAKAIEQIERLDDHIEKKSEVAGGLVAA
jgi:glucitol operon activator protein